MLIVCLCAAAYAGERISATEAENARTEKQASGYLDVGGAKIYYETRGSGPAIVLLHDGLLSSVTWDEVWEPLPTKHRVIRYDRRGYGRSELPRSSYSSVEDLRELLAHGGALAIDFAIAHREMVDGLFLIGPVLHGIEFSEQFLERARRNNEPMERGDVKAWATNWSQDRFLIAGAKEAARRRIYEQLVENAEKLRKFDAALEEKLSPPASQRLSEIKAPTLILAGVADIADVHAQCRAIDSGISKSERIVVKDAGHLIQLEKPDEIVKKVENFAQRCERKRAR